MAKLIEITGKALAGEWGTDDETGEGIPVLRTTNFTNEGVVDYSDVVTRTITKKNIGEKFLRAGEIIIEKSGGSDKYLGSSSVILSSKTFLELSIKYSLLSIPDGGL